MFVAQVAIRFHAQRAAIFVAEPARHGGDIDAALDADGREQMPEIVMCYPLHSDLCGSVRHAVLTLEDPHDRSGWRFNQSLCAQVGEHLFKLGNHGYESRLAVFRRRLGIAADVQLPANEIRICPGDVFCLANPETAVSEKPNEVRAVLRLSCSGRADFVNESQELISRWEFELLLAHLYPREPGGRIVEAGASADCFVEDSPQRSDAVVHDGRRVMSLISSEPVFAVALTQLPHIGLE